MLLTDSVFYSIILQFILGQFEHMTQLLRHFYAFFVMKSSWNDSTIILKMKKILNLLEDKLNSISAYKKELQARPSAGSGQHIIIVISAS